MVNTPPTAPTVVLLPAAPTTANNLLVSASGSSDADGHNISYDYEWYLNGALTANTSSAAISSADTNKGEIWTARVIPNDGYHQGQYAEASVVIENSAPVLSSVSITPGTPNTTDLVTCAAAATDADGETLTETYSWTNVTTGAQLGLGTTLQLTENNSANGDVLRCDAEVADSDSSVTGSATVTVVFVNRAPDTPVLSITQTQQTLHPPDLHLDQRHRSRWRSGDRFILLVCQQHSSAAGDSANLRWQPQLR